MSNKSTPSLLFAALRRTNLDGTKVLILVDPTSGKCFEENEETLKNPPFQIALGDFLHVTIDEETNSNSYSKTTVPHEWKVQVLKDVAFVSNVKSKLHNEDGKKVFRNSFFADQLYQGAAESMWRGMLYRVRIRLLSMPHKISSSTVLHFEATKPQLIRIPKRFEPSKPLPLCQLLHPPQSRTISSCSSTHLPSVPEKKEKEEKTITTALIKMPSPQSSTYLPLPPGAERKLSLVRLSLESLNFKDKVLNYLANKSKRHWKKKVKKIKGRNAIIRKPQKSPVS